MSGDNPWGALNSSAQNGVFRLDDGVARRAANACADAWDQLVNASGGTSWGSVSMTAVDEFGNLQSGKDLSRFFQDMGTELVNDILPKYERALKDMGEAFIIGGNLLEGSDESAAGMFQGMKDRSEADQAVSDIGTRPAEDYDTGVEDGRVLDTQLPPDYSDGAYAIYDDDPNNDSERFKKGSTYAAAGGAPPLDGSQPGMRTADVDPEPPSYLSHERAVSLGNAIRMNSNANDVRSLAATWKSMGEKIDVMSFTLKQTIDNEIRNGWDGSSADQATAAVERFRGSGKQLAQNMMQISGVLLNASGWLTATDLGMPFVETTDEARRHAETLIAQEAFLNWYTPGLLASAVLPGLVPPAGMGTPTGDENGGRDGGGGGGGGNGGGGGGGAGSPEQLQQQRALDEIDQQRAELLEAQQQLEEQAQAQQAALQQQQQALEQQPGAQQMLQAAQQGLQQLGQMGQQLSTAAQQALQQAGITGLPGMPALQDAVKNYQSALQKAGKLPAGLGGGAGGSSGAGAPVKPGPLPNLEKASKLFPRASLATTSTASGQSVGVAASSMGAGAPMGGMPMGGAGGAAQGGQQKDHKRADYLDSTEWLEEGIGDPSIVAKPVVDS
ncbi:WXG100 family type VII secretion target [Nocardia sp. NPDC003345]